MVSAEEIRKLASLAKLRLTDEEVERMAREMSAIVAFADAVNAEPIDAEAAARGYMLPGRVPDGAGVNADGTRPDETAPSLPREEILRNAGGGAEGYFLLKRRKA